jgi:hypothetical protein
VDKYGPAERYDFVNLLDRLNCPALFVFGELELASSVAFFGLDEAVALAPAGSSTRDVAKIAGANHFYVGVTAALAERVGLWLREKFPA